MSSSAREAIKWIAVLLMTFDHVAKVIFGGYVPVLSELGRMAFPLFGMVMAYNLAQPGADVMKSVRRLSLWALIAQPVHAMAFGYWLPLNVLFSFAVAALAIWALISRKWVTLTLAAGVFPAFVDYNWWGLLFVGFSWLAYTRSAAWFLVPAYSTICLFNGNGWALAALPVALVVGQARFPLPRSRWAFYAYYVGHLAALGLISSDWRLTAFP